MAKRETWGSTFGFIMAAIGSAIGLGNVWKFPYVTGMNGGGAFLLIYLFCILLLGVPVMICEMAVGRRTQRNAYGAYKMLQLRKSVICNIIAWGFMLGGAALLGCGSFGFGAVSLAAGVLLLKFQFSAFGLLAIFGALAILSYYAVVGGWILDYTFRAFTWQLNYTDVEAAGKGFTQLAETPWRVLAGFAVFMLCCTLMLFGGVQKGIEKWSKMLMPLLFILLLAVIARSVTLPGAMAGIKFFLSPDFSKLTAAGVLEALGHCFYSLSLGMGITVTYGSYLTEKTNIFTASIWVMVLDTAAAVLAGLAIFPAVFAMGFKPDAGPSLIFNVLPVTFNSFPGGSGWIWAGLFFLMLSIAAVTSGVSLLQNGISFFMDELKWSHRKSLWVAVTGVSIFGVLSAVSIASWKHIQGVYRVLAKIFGETHIPSSFFNMLDYLTSNWMLPIGGMAMCIFIGWVWSAKRAARELRIGAENSAVDVNLITLLSGFRGEAMYKTSRNHGLTLLSLWAIIVRFFAPAVIFIIFLRAVGVNVGF